LMNALYDFVFHIAVGDVAPPNQDIRSLQHALGQSVLRLLQRRRLADEVFRRGQPLGYRGVHAIGINLLDRLVLAFVAKLVPNGDVDLCTHGAGLNSKTIEQRRGFSALPYRMHFLHALQLSVKSFWIVQPCFIRFTLKMWPPSGGPRRFLAVLTSTVSAS